MKYYGYNRTSTKIQHLDRGEIDIKDFCNKNGYKLSKIFSDKQTGRNFDRPRYTVLKEDVLSEGDVLIIPEADRLGRNKAETLEELRYFKNNGIRVMILDIPTTLMDLSNYDDNIAILFLNTINNMMIELYVTIAQAEVDKKHIQQQKGIEAMKKRGEWDKYGRPKIMDFEDFKKQYERVLNDEITPFKLIEELGLSTSTYYRYKKKADIEKE